MNEFAIPAQHFCDSSNTQLLCCMQHTCTYTEWDIHMLMSVNNQMSTKNVDGIITHVSGCLSVLHEIKPAQESYPNQMYNVLHPYLSCVIQPP